MKCGEIKNMFFWPLHFQAHHIKDFAHLRVEPQLTDAAGDVLPLGSGGGEAQRVVEDGLLHRVYLQGGVTGRGGASYYQVLHVHFDTRSPIFRFFFHLLLEWSCVPDLQHRGEVYLAFCLKPPAKMFVCNQKKERKWALLLSLLFFQSKLEKRSDESKFFKFLCFWKQQDIHIFPSPNWKGHLWSQTTTASKNFPMFFFSPRRNRIHLNNLIHYNFYCLSLRTRRPSTLVTPAVTSATTRQEKCKPLDTFQSRVCLSVILFLCILSFSRWAFLH